MNVSHGDNNYQLESSKTAFTGHEKSPENDPYFANVCTYGWRITRWPANRLTRTGRLQRSLHTRRSAVDAYDPRHLDGWPHTQDVSTSSTVLTHTKNFVSTVLIRRHCAVMCDAPPSVSDTDQLPGA